MPASGVLEKISLQVAQRLAARKVLLSEAALLELCRKARKPHNFSNAFLGPGFSVIAEVKFASPSQGTFEKAHALSPLDIARDYLQNGAAALSVLTEEDHFQGHPQNLIDIRKAFPEAKILMKDFILEKYQILEALYRGADAILLIVALLEKETIAELQKFSQELGLSVLVEVHNEEEFKIARGIGAKLIGVNNRNLRTLEVSLETSRRLAKLDSGKATLIAESGLNTRENLEELKKIGYSGFLIGTSLMKAGQPGQALAALLRPHG